MSGLPRLIWASAGPLRNFASSASLPASSLIRRPPLPKPPVQPPSGLAGHGPGGAGHGVVATMLTVTPALFSGLAGSPQMKSARLLLLAPTRCTLCPSPVTVVGVPISRLLGPA